MCECLMFGSVCECVSLCVCKSVCVCVSVFVSGCVCMAECGFVYVSAWVGLLACDGSYERAYERQITQIEI